MLDLDFLFLMEHEDREGSTLRILKDLLEGEGFSCKILSIEFHSHLFRNIQPKVVVFPYAIDTYSWPVSFFNKPIYNNTRLVTLNWEQLLSNSNREFKRPKGKLICKEFFHYSWSDDFKSFLVESGVNQDNIKVLGNPNHFLLARSLSDSSDWNKKIRSRYNLESKKSIIFMPMNYGWAFASDHSIQFKISKGYNSEVAWNYREYSKKCFKEFIIFLDALAKNYNDSVIVVRPHPSISCEKYIDAYLEAHGSTPYNLIFSKEFSVKEWIAVADLIGSSWSTTVWDAHSLGKKAFLFTPFCRPEWLDTYWNSKVPNFQSVSSLSSYVFERTEHKIEPVSKDLFDKITLWLKEIYLTDVNNHISKNSGMRLGYGLVSYAKFARSIYRTILCKFFKGRFIDSGLYRDYFDYDKY